MIKIPPCDLPMVPLYHWQQKNVQGFFGKNGTNSTIGRFADFTIGRTPNVAIVNKNMVSKGLHTIITILEVISLKENMAQVVHCG